MPCLSVNNCSLIEHCISFILIQHSQDPSQIICSTFLLLSLNIILSFLECVEHFHGSHFTFPSGTWWYLILFFGGSKKLQEWILQMIRGLLQTTAPGKAIKYFFKQRGATFLKESKRIWEFSVSSFRRFYPYAPIPIFKVSLCLNKSPIFIIIDSMKL